ncbi:MAG TPA: DUF4367 domain-containing protein [Candidatus Saccharimonadales bacterium]|nr:DUF4367 domain-containing protein [Candidatus Saccharimonadales bacterium]
MSPLRKTIRINGKEYDAVTGKPAQESIDPLTSHEQFLKDIEKFDHLPLGSKKTFKTRASKARRLPVRITADVRRSPQKSSTLMRPTVKKPSAKPPHKSAADVTEKPVPLTLPHNRDRERRAKQVPKSKKITKFNFAIKPHVVPVRKVDNLEVKHPRPHTQRTSHQSIDSITIVKKPSRPQHDWPVIDQFEKAVQEASSHLETFVDEATHYKKRRKFAYATASLVAIFALGFTAYTAIPTAKVKLAGNKAGFSAEIPEYSPAGYGLQDPVEADYGKVTLSYKSRTDNKGFKLIQEPSKWNSDSLAANFLGAKDGEYRTVKGAGHTIYTYGESGATWVDGGIWFKLEGNASLSEDQLLKIANSL